MKGYIKVAIAILALLSLSATSKVYAQKAPTFTVKGQLIDSLENETIPFASIKITGQKDTKTLLKVLASDGDGKFEFTIGKGNYLLGVQYIGKAVLSKPFTVGDEKVLDFGKLYTAANAQMLGEITVTAEKPLVKVDLDKIIYSLESDPEAKTSNVLDMLRKVPLVTVNGDDEIELKGEKNYKIYLDGKPSAMIDSNPKDVLKSMPAGSIKDIEIITDPGAKYDAEGVAGIINIITNKNSSLGGYTVNLNAGGNTMSNIYGGVNFTLKYGKIGFTGNYNMYSYDPSGQMSGSFRETFPSETVTDPRTLASAGRSKYSGSGLYGGGQISYEIDTLNLLQFSFNKYGGNNKYNSTTHTLEERNGILDDEYNRYNNGKYKYGSNTIGADYQRTFSVKDRLLTVSYRLDLAPDANYNESFSTEEHVQKPILDRKTEQLIDGSSYTHTGQVDFTTPIAKIHTIETGLKFTNRVNKGDNSREEWDFMEELWENVITSNDEYRNEQNVLAAYAGYSLKLKKWGLKSGLRYEGTWMKSEFPIDTERNFDRNYSNVVPSATVTYQLKPGQTLRVGYNMSISRPGIWQLNPYRDESDPRNISMGNPNLAAAKNHSFNLNYTYFNPKFNMNANLSYRFVNNGVNRVSNIYEETLENGTVVQTRETTYANIGKSSGLNFSLYANWSPTQKFRIYGNAGFRYSYDENFDSDNKKFKSEGVRPQLSGGVQYTLPWKLMTAANGGYYGKWRNLEFEGPVFYYYNLSVSKSFIKDKLTVKVYTDNPFQKERTMKTKQENLYYRNENWNIHRMRSFGLNISFRFGELKERIKTTKRGISGSDQMEGNGGGQGGGEGSGGGQ